MCRAGLGSLGVSLVAGLVLVTRAVFGGAFGFVAGVIGSAVVVLAWVVLPGVAARQDGRRLPT
jgi:hypothetical protein